MSGASSATTKHCMAVTRLAKPTDQSKALLRFGALEKGLGSDYGALLQLLGDVMPRNGKSSGKEMENQLETGIKPARVGVGAQCKAR